MNIKNHKPFPITERNLVETTLDYAPLCCKKFVSRYSLNYSCLDIEVPVGLAVNTLEMDCYVKSGGSKEANNLFLLNFKKLFNFIEIEFDLESRKLNIAGDKEIQGTATINIPIFSFENSSDDLVIEVKPVHQNIDILATFLSDENNKESNKIVIVMKIEKVGYRRITLSSITEDKTPFLWSLFQR